MSSICAQCDDYNLLQCSNNDNCEWVENIQYENCDEIGGEISDCQQFEGCEWNCDSWYTWLCGCEGQYQVDFSYCTEIQSSECSGINQSDCINNQFCNWIENVEYGYCSEFDQNTNACEATAGCYGAYQYPGWYSGWYCAGGNYQIDNSYCQEIQNPECSELNQNQCNHPEYGESCDWIEDYQWSSCSNYDSAVECSWANNNGGNCDWSWNSTQWQDTCSGGSFQLDTSYCEEAQYELGDINEDDIINVMDIISVVNLILNDRYEEIADLNQDQYINVIDILLIVDIILNN